MSIYGTKIRNCRLCESNDLTKIVDFGEIPLGNNLQKNFQKAINAEVYELGLNCCDNCKHYQLSFSVDKTKLFAENYTYLSSIGKSGRKLLSKLNS